MCSVECVGSQKPTDLCLMHENSGTNLWGKCRDFSERKWKIGGKKSGEGDERDERDDTGKFKEKRRATSIFDDCCVMWDPLWDILRLWDCFLSSAVPKCHRSDHLQRGLLPYVLHEWPGGWRTVEKLRGREQITKIYRAHEDKVEQVYTSPQL